MVPSWEPAETSKAGHNGPDNGLCAPRAARPDSPSPQPVMGSKLLTSLGVTPAIAQVCRTEKLEFVRSLGADRVIAYTTTDYTKAGERY